MLLVMPKFVPNRRVCQWMLRRPGKRLLLCKINGWILICIFSAFFSDMDPFCNVGFGCRLQGNVAGFALIFYHVCLSVTCECESHRATITWIGPRLVGASLLYADVSISSSTICLSGTSRCGGLSHWVCALSEVVINELAQPLDAFCFVRIDFR